MEKIKSFNLRVSRTCDHGKKGHDKNKQSRKNILWVDIRAKAEKQTNNNKKKEVVCVWKVTNVSSTSRR